jgi:tetratricopeptide (TPR) repeat protein
MDTYYTTDENINTATASLYLEMRSFYYNWFFTKNLLSDDVWAGGGQRGDNGQMEELNEYSFDTNHSMIESVYSGLYGIIYKANLIIDKTEGDTPVMNRAINEAKVFRAFGHFELASLFGTAPVVDHLLEASEYRQANGTATELWACVEKDLTEAIGSGTLPSKSSVNDQETGIRVTKEYAQAMLGKAFLFQGKYAEAASMLDNVINSNKYALFEGEYDAQFHAAANNNCESLFELQKRNDAEQLWNTFDFVHIMQGWRTSVLSYGVPAVMELALGTYGFINPRKSLYEAFVAWEGADGYRLNKTIMNYDQMTAYGVSVQPGAAVYGNEGYFFWKNQSLREDCITDMSYFQVGQFIDLKVMRYAEVLLMAAEAQLQAGNASKALQYINEVRARAKETPLTAVAMNDIKTEKRLELCNEAVRYQDLIRWGDAKTAMGEQGKQVPAFTGTDIQWNWQNTKYGFQDKHMLLPIPLKELELNPNMQQNAGW